MKRFFIVIEKTAQGNIQASYAWGVEVWGKNAADVWVSVLKTKILTLGHFSNRYPIAPESQLFKVIIRQMIIGRYRVLFTVKEKTVHVLHIRGPYEE